MYERQGERGVDIGSIESHKIRREDHCKPTFDDQSDGIGNEDREHDTISFEPTYKCPFNQQP